LSSVYAALAEKERRLISERPAARGHPSSELGNHERHALRHQARYECHVV
jgi:hypothetical protein